MHFLITAGGTREYIDPVRFISNASTGKMGYALARAGKNAGNKVTLVTAPTNLKPPQGVKVVNVETSKQMLDAVKNNFVKCDRLIMTAAVSDYTVASQAKTKIKKAAQLLTLKLRPTADILKWAGKNKNKHQKVIGFALEDKAVRANAEKKLIDKKLDMVIANTPAAIGADRSTVQIKTPEMNWIKIENSTKTAIAKKIIALVEKL